MAALGPDRFPGARGDWARFDGAAGTQMLDDAIDAMSAWSAGGDNANAGGAFAAAIATDELVAAARASVARLLGASADGVWFGPNMTTMTLAFTRTLARDWRAGDRVVVTRLDHDANVTPWVLAARDRGVDVAFADFDPADGRLAPEAVLDLVDERTVWVAVTGASNLLGTMPPLAPILAGAHAAGARVFVDAVHLVPHAPVDVGALGCDALVTSAYKWYGPHAAAMSVDPELLAAIDPYKVRPAPDTGPGRLETGTTSFEALAGVRAAADALVTEGISEIAAYERGVFAPLLDGLHSIAGVRVVGPPDVAERAPTVAFVVDGHAPDEVASTLARDRLAVWAGHSYAVEAVAHLGLAAHGGVVRAGVVRYVTADDVDRLLDAVARIAAR